MTRTLNGEDLLGDKIWAEYFNTFPAKEIAAGKRIGIDYAAEDAENPWRFWIKDNIFVSKSRNRER